MKAWLLLTFTIFKLIVPIMAQEETQNQAWQEETAKQTDYRKGESLLNLKFQTYQKNKIGDSFYQSNSLGIGGGYYFLDRIAFKATLMGQYYNALELVTPTKQEYNNKYLLQVSSQIRYHLGEVPGSASIFIQSGYSFGKFIENENINVKRWEIISLGATERFNNNELKNIGLEAGAGIEKENLSKKIVFSGYIGLNYYLSN
jgi:hypothetical protein